MPSSYTLGNHFDDFIRQLTASGRYASASEVVRDGLRLLEEREEFREVKLAALRSAIDDGLASGPEEIWSASSMKTFVRQAG
jgi:antitoxin ParD1/3/4